ncbi:hypothetical protein RB598_008964 [Gaeumannomyces tritici]
MVKAAAVVSTPTGPGIYSATYSGIPVYEYQFGVDLKEHVMRRRHDDWINATHILKAAGFDKPARTRILEREVQKDTHEKIQGGYGKYQGTWIPLESGEALANRNNIYDRLRPIFEYVPGAESPPPAPRHASKPKQPKKPAVPKFNSKAARAAAAAAAASQAPPQPVPYSAAPTPQEGFDNADVLMEEDGTPDNLTVASASYLAEEDRHDLSHFSTGHRKRKREEMLQDLSDQQHSVYGDELLDYFLLSRNERPAIRPDPPTNFQPDWTIDMDRHTALHWAAAMGDVEIIKQLKRFGARLDAQNLRGETPLMRAVNFTNCYEKQTFPVVMKELFETVDHRDLAGCTVIHHAAIMKSGRVSSPSCSRYYLDNILNRLQETQGSDFVQQLLDVQDMDGNTAVHLAAQRGASKCIRALLGRGASTDVANNEGIRAEDLIRELNASKKARSAPQRSSSPFAPESQRHVSFRDALGVHAAGEGAAGMAGSTASAAHHTHHGPVGSKLAVSYKSDAALTVQNRITPLVFEKFHELARSYEDEWREKDEAEREAARILSNAQAELDAARAQAAEIESMLQPEPAASRLEAEVAAVAGKVTSFVSHQNRIAVEGLVDRELGAAAEAAEGAMNGGGSGGDGSGAGNAVEERFRLANELRQLLAEQQVAEAEYVDALSVVGTGENIEQYKRLLKICLGPEAESLDDNLDGIIEMMEEEAVDGAGGDAPGLEEQPMTDATAGLNGTMPGSMAPPDPHFGAPEPMEISVL